MDDFDEQRFAGTWFVVASTFPLWLKGKRHSPRFQYGVLAPGRLSDRVMYRRDGREQVLDGVDTRLPGATPAFRWRGTGLLRLVKSDWQVTHRDPQYRWAVIGFTRSLLTPAGVDIIARTPGIPAGIPADVLAQPGLTAIPHAQ
ncbi:hypothetical protein F4553_001858 [Allocatelliglobosispora scoriae]|uniref:Lipocalin/cytosolic fatty-acid binding domain-containing protein n=1 Tax=Allocatelliglobosispora scoriae TaxID=643052 RepID=A0A841BMR8_9ACTN|nr:lipocalin family protein [Allocatelliglobosispora scoriae]MBB5868479.1 hypothetical protein [Allocatelliglobosispora scoriae]